MFLFCYNGRIEVYTTISISRNSFSKIYMDTGVGGMSLKYKGILLNCEGYTLKITMHKTYLYILVVL